MFSWLAYGGVSSAVVLALLPSPAGVGDPVFPSYGNNGYQARHYAIDVTYRPADGLLTGVTAIQAYATESLSRFDLDLVLTATSVTVDGQPARFRQYVISGNGQHGGKLEVTPARSIRRHAAMTVVVRYAGTPEKLTIDGTNPWYRTPSGAVVEGAPEAAAWWFPSNDHLGDKADYSVSLTAPSDLVGVSTGSLVSQRTTNGWTTRRWRETAPIATYQVFAAFGNYRIITGHSATGIPLMYAISANPGPGGEAAKRDILHTGDVLDWLVRQWGPYPYASGGGVLTDNTWAGLETATHPIYGDYVWTDKFKKPFPQWNVVVHENAHQWFGDSVTPADWRYFWLSEGFATYSEWLWSEQHGNDSAATAFAQMWSRFPAGSPLWTIHIGALRDYPEWASGAAYFRGAMALQALRVRLGDATFFRLMRGWVALHRNGNVTTTQFTTLAERISGQDLTGFFQAWLYTPRRPDPTPENGIPVG
ncbi:M1 family metallopeptidase [Fodinicola acaciae]|uniref:M1 family metallopeptidase n=1 Tax=Fodinicola acaciae TaxID=2681555 RepID=UPI0013D228F7|nr:M1 family metallopeptidase [Fodinicola acaciae]